MFTGLDRKYLFRALRDIQASLDDLMEAVAREETEVMASIQDLADKVSEQTTVIDGVTALLDGLAQQVRDAGADPTKLDAVVAAIQANSDKLAAAVARDTAAADEPHAAGM